VFRAGWFVEMQLALVDSAASSDCEIT
jgi:hypothetical protein